MTDNAGQLDSLADDLFDAGVVAAVSPLVYEPKLLLPAERDFVARAVESRQREFATGRVLARRLLSGFSVAEVPLLKDEDRVPVWPPGFVGSISHCRDLCVVAVAPAGAQRGLGVDVEPDEPVSKDIERVVCVDSERPWLAAASEPDDRARRVRVIFSAKEATYKAFYPQLRTFWSFQDVSVEIDLDRESFRARLPAGADVAEVNGRILRRQGWILSSVCRGPR